MGVRALAKPREYSKVETPQCEGSIVGPQPKYRLAGGTQCWRTSQYEIDGKYYCAFHAGKVALDRLLANA